LCGGEAPYDWRNEEPEKVSLRKKLGALGIIGLITGIAGGLGMCYGLGKGYETKNTPLKSEPDKKDEGVPKVRNFSLDRLATPLNKSIDYTWIPDVLWKDAKRKHASKLNQTLKEDDTVQNRTIVPEKINQTDKVNEEKLKREAEILEHVKSCPYDPSEYVRGKFDCSNMAKMLHDWLTERWGHHCTVVYIENKTYGIKHNFVFVDGYAVEPTWKYWAKWYYEKWFKIDKLKYLKPWQMHGDAFKYPRRW